MMESFSLWVCRFEVSEVLSRMLPMLSVDETLLKVYEWKPLASNKSTRRYMPYYNVDSFLRVGFSPRTPLY